jgi:hypothetical protein
MAASGEEASIVICRPGDSTTAPKQSLCSQLSRIESGSAAGKSYR